MKCLAQKLWKCQFCQSATFVLLKEHWRSESGAHKCCRLLLFKERGFLPLSKLSCRHTRRLCLSRCYFHTGAVISFIGILLGPPSPQRSPRVPIRTEGRSNNATRLSAAVRGVPVVQGIFGTCGYSRQVGLWSCQLWVVTPRGPLWISKNTALPVQHCFLHLSNARQDIVSCNGDGSPRLRSTRRTWAS